MSSSVVLLRPPHKAGTDATTGKADSIRVLVVEDERIVAADLQRLLRQLGYDAYGTAPTAERALALAAKTPPDVVLADIRIEGPVDGIDTALQLREKHGAAIVFLTAHTDDAILERAKVVEPAGYLVKPIAGPAVKAAVELAFDRRRRETAIRSFEALLAENSADLISALNHLTLALQLEDAAGRILHINPAFSALFDIPGTRIDLIGIPGSAIVEYVQSLCQDAEAYATLVERLHCSERPVSGQPITLLDGRRLELDYVPVFQGNRRHGQLWTYRDITESERLREELERSAIRHRYKGR